MGQLRRRAVRGRRYPARQLETSGVDEIDHSVSLSGYRAPAGRRVVAIGDIHGEIGLLDEILAAIRSRFDIQSADAADNGVELVFLGDYVDRGPDSAGVVDRLLALADGPTAPTFLMGNHEDMLLRFMRRGDVASAETWLANGGVETLESYGVAPPRAIQLREDLVPAREALDAALPDRHRAFLSDLKLSHSVGELTFVHAGLRPGIPLVEQRDTDLIWIREAFMESQEDHGSLVVHGHTTRFGPEVRHNRIGLDTGAGKGGYLTAAVFWGSEVSFLHAGA